LHFAAPKGDPVLDLVFLVTIVCFFAVAAVYVRGCDRL
jgi:hypothetical protein